MNYLAEYYLAKSRTVSQSIIEADTIAEATDKAQELTGSTIQLVNVEPIFPERAKKIYS
jgi:hypothetical protein